MKKILGATPRSRTNSKRNKNRAVCPRGVVFKALGLISNCFQEPQRLVIYDKRLTQTIFIMLARRRQLPWPYSNFEKLYMDLVPHINTSISSINECFCLKMWHDFSPKVHYKHEKLPKTPQLHKFLPFSCFFFYKFHLRWIYIFGTEFVGYATNWLLKNCYALLLYNKLTNEQLRFVHQKVLNVLCAIFSL